MGRLREEMLQRVEVFSDRMLDVAVTLEGQRRFARVIDQVVGCGTSVGANLYEADQALSPKDFVKTLGVVVKELNECKFWLRTVARRGWIRPPRLEGLVLEAEELLSILNAMIVRTRNRSTPAKPRKRI